MMITVDVHTGSVRATCDRCHTAHRTVDMRTMRITTPTGHYGHRVMDVRVRGGVTGRTETKRVAYPLAATVTLSLCPTCAHTVDTAVRRNICTARDVGA